MKKPKIVKKSSIDWNKIYVAAYNADPFAVENKDLLDELKEELKDTYYLSRYSKDTEEFDELARKLYASAENIKYIYAAGSVIMGVLR